MDVRTPANAPDSTSSSSVLMADSKCLCSDMIRMSEYKLFKASVGRKANWQR
jgi:hypothetical protein